MTQKNQPLNTTLLVHVKHALVLTLVSLFIFFSIAMSLTESLTLFFNTGSHRAEHWISKLLKQPVQMRTFKIKWQNLTTLALQGKEVTIWNDAYTRPLLKVDKLNIQINILSSLLKTKVDFSQIKITGLHLILQQNANNELIFDGINTLISKHTANHQTDLNEIIDWFLSEPQLILENIHLTFHEKSGQTWRSKIYLALQSNAASHQLNSIISLIQKVPTQINLHATMSGNWSEKEKIKTRIYVACKDCLLATWLNQRLQLFNQFAIQRGIADLKIWADWSNQHFSKVQALIDSKQITIGDLENSTHLTIDPLSASMTWEPTQNDWLMKATVKHLSFSRWNSAPQRIQNRGQTTGTHFVPRNTQEHERTEEQRREILKDERYMPGIKGLHAYLQLTKNDGLIITDAQNVQLDFGKLFKAPLKLDQLSSRVTWQKESAGWLVEAPHFYAANQDIETNSQFSLRLSDDQSSPTLDIVTSFKIRPHKNIAYYLPLTVLQPNLVKWLDHSIQTAEAEGTFVLRGKIDEFPFDDNRGTFLIDADIKNTTLDYEAGWPPLEKFNGEFIFSGRKIQATIKSGTFFGTALQNVYAEIPLIKKGIPSWLLIKADKIQSDLKQGLQFLASSPLRHDMGNYLNEISLVGPMQLRLNLNIPLESKTQKTQLSGQVDIDKGQFNVPSHDLTINNLQGRLLLTNNGTRSNNLTGILWDKPIAIHLQTKPLQLTALYNGIKTRLLPEENGWTLTVFDPRAQGNVFIPREKRQPMLARFKYLYFDTQQAASHSSWQPYRIPNMDFTSDKLLYGTQQFSDVSAKLRHIFNGVAIEKLTAETKTSKLTASGSWRQTPTGALTQFTGQITNQNLNELLSSWELAPGIQAQKSYITFSLQWPGAPDDYNLKNTDGLVSFHAQNGQIIKLSESAKTKISFGRLLTALSPASIKKHIQSNFTDFNSSGLDFNVLKGSFFLKDGIATTKNLLLNGPIALINMKGEINLVKKTCDLKIKITPHFTSNLPVIAAFAAGPTIGLATLLADALLASQIQKIASTTYRLVGPCENPQALNSTF